MERITLPNAPTDLSPMDAALDYSFGDNKFARVILEMSQSDNDMFIIKAQAYEMDAAGNYAMAPKGYPSRTRQTTHTVAASSLGDTATLVPGWVRMAPPNKVNYAMDSESLPEGTQQLDALPATGNAGEHVMVGDTLYAWNIGVARQVAQGKVEELEQTLRVSVPLSNMGFDHSAL